MATSLVDFLGRLAQDPELLDAFRADKAGTMNQYDVADDDQEAVLSGDPDRIRAAVGDEVMEEQQLDMDLFM
jgi:hypothetical protein